MAQAITFILNLNIIIFSKCFRTYTPFTQLFRSVQFNLLYIIVKRQTVILDSITFTHNKMIFLTFTHTHTHNMPLHGESYG